MSCLLPWLPIDQPILYFRRNAFLPIKEEKRLIAKKNSKLALTLLYKEVKYCSIITSFQCFVGTGVQRGTIKYCSITFYVLSVQAVYNVVHGLYPLSDDEVTELAGIQCAVENSQFDEAEHTPEAFKYDYT